MKFAFLLLPLFLISCASLQTKKVTLKTPYDAEQMKKLLAPGDAKIVGNAFIPQAGGGLVTCAGKPIVLAPVTDFTTELYSVIFKNLKKDYVSANELPPKIEYTPFPTEYYAIQKVTKCDSQGNFEFNDIKAGAYYLISENIWNVAQYTKSGGLYIETIEVKPKQVLKGVFSP